MVILIPTDVGTNLSQEKRFNFSYTKAGCNTYLLYIHLLVTIEYMKFQYGLRDFQMPVYIKKYFEYVLKGVMSHAPISEQSLFGCLICFLLSICSGLFFVKAWVF